MAKVQAVTEKKACLSLTYNEAGLIIYMFPHDWHGTDKELEIVSEMCDEIEKALAAKSDAINALRDEFNKAKISKEEYIAKTSEIGDSETVVLTLGRPFNFLKQQFPTRKFPRSYAKSVISLRDKLGLI